MPTLLLVEDDIALRKQIRFSLEENFNVLEAENRKEATELLRKNPIDVVILDLGLPPNEGTPEEGLIVLSSILNHYTSKVIILTGQKTEGVALEAIKSGGKCCKLFYALCISIGLRFG